MMQRRLNCWVSFVLSFNERRTLVCFSREQTGIEATKWEHLRIGSPRGWNRTSLTAPRCPGSLFKSFPVRTSQMATLWSPLPAAIFSPFESQLAFRRLRSCPVGAPSYVCMRRSAGANGLTSHVLTVESCAFDSRVWLSGDS